MTDPATFKSPKRPNTWYPQQTKFKTPKGSFKIKWDFPWWMTLKNGNKIKFKNYMDLHKYIKNIFFRARVIRSIKKTFY